MAKHQTEDIVVGEVGLAKPAVWFIAAMLALVFLRLWRMGGGAKLQIYQKIQVEYPVRLKVSDRFWYRNLYFVIDSQGEKTEFNQWVGYKIKLTGMTESVISRGVRQDKYRVAVDKVEVVDSLRLKIMWRSLDKLRVFLRGKIDSFLPWPESALMKGLLFGTKEDLGEYEKYLKVTGTIHTVAASGFNVMIVFGAVFYSLLVFWPRRLVLWVSLAMIWLYGLMAGMSPPVVRAVVMGSVMIAAWIRRGLYQGLYGLMVGVLLVLVVWPEFAGSVSFQLSVLATVGIMGLGGWLKRKLGWLGEDLRVTLAAQITTWPFLSFYFGSFNLLSLAANGLILWSVPVLTIWGGAVLMISVVSERAAAVLGVGLWLISAYFLNVVKWLAGIDWFLWRQRLNLALILAYYLFLGVWAVRRYKRWILSG